MGIDDNIKHQTGSHESLEDYKIITYPIGIYEIKVKLTSSDKFIEIVEVKVNQDFLSHKQKMAHKGFLDVEKYYQD
jgi:hypothetical protein